MRDFYDYMGMDRVVTDPDGKPIQLTGSGLELSGVVKLAVTGVSAAMLLQIPATIGAIYAPALPNSAMSHRTQRETSITDRIVFCRNQFSLNMTQLASALRLERQTLYGWVSGTSFPHTDNEKRLNVIVAIARDWGRFFKEPVGKSRTHQLSNGRTLCEMLSDEEIDVFEIRNLFGELKQVSAVRSRGQERRELSEALGYNSSSREDAAERLKMNLPI